MYTFCKRAVQRNLYPFPVSSACNARKNRSSPWVAGSRIHTGVANAGRSASDFEHSFNCERKSPILVWLTQLFRAAGAEFLGSVTCFLLCKVTCVEVRR